MVKSIQTDECTIKNFTTLRLADERYNSPKKAAFCKHGRSPIFNVKLEEKLVHFVL